MFPAISESVFYVLMRDSAVTVRQPVFYHRNGNSSVEHPFGDIYTFVIA